MTDTTAIEAPQLAHLNDVAALAYSRGFGTPPGSDDRSGVLYVLVSGWYGTPGYTLWIDGDPETGFELLEIEPKGVVADVVTYYGACWNSRQKLSEPPEYITIKDASGTRQVPVEVWIDGPS